jgi:hypothetical protein
MKRKEEVKHLPSKKIKDENTQADLPHGSHPDISMVDEEDDVQQVWSRPPVPAINPKKDSIG